MRISLTCRRNSFLQDYAITFKFDELCEISIHAGGSQRTQEKLHKKMGGLED